MPRRIRRDDRRASNKRQRNLRGRTKSSEGRQQASADATLPANLHSFIDSDYSAVDGRVLGVDYGEKRVGLALSDPMGMIAQGLATKETDHVDQTLNMIAAEAEDHQVSQIIVGLPINMDGTTGKMAKLVDDFVERLRLRVSCPVQTWDERLTSAAAERAMTEMGYTTKDHKKKVDRIAATLLLQSYLDHQRHTTG